MRNSELFIGMGRLLDLIFCFKASRYQICSYFSVIQKQIKYSIPLSVLDKPPYRIKEQGYAGFEIYVDLYFKGLSDSDSARKVRLVLYRTFELAVSIMRSRIYTLYYPALIIIPWPFNACHIGLFSICYPRAKKSIVNHLCDFMQQLCWACMIFPKIRHL